MRAGRLALPDDPLACGPDALGVGALAYAPEVAGDAAITPAVLPQDALPAVAPEDARAQLERVLAGPRADAVFRAARTFDDQVGDGRTMDPVTLGLLWLSEGGALLPARLDPNHPDFGGEMATWIDALTKLQPAGLSEFRRSWRISNIGLWGFGLDDIFKLVNGAIGDLDFDTSLKRWGQRLRDHADWAKGVPFATTQATTVPPVVTTVAPVEIRFATAEALGPLRDGDPEFGLPVTLQNLVKDSTATAPDGGRARDVLAEVAARADWDPIPAEASLDADGRALLERLVDAWAAYAARMARVPAPTTPGELLFHGSDDTAPPLLFPSALGTTGFGARNFGERFVTATRLPLGSICQREVPAAP